MLYSNTDTHVNASTHGGYFSRNLHGWFKGRKRDCPLKLINLLSAIGTGVKYSPEWDLQVCIV